MKELHGVRCCLLDLDGTVYLGDQLFPWTVPFLQKLEAHHIGHLFLTNNSSRSTQAYIRKFASLGMCVQESEILISTHAAADYLARQYPGRRVFVLGTESMRRELSSCGITVSDEEPEVLLAGFDTALEYDRLTRFCNLVAMGLPYVATHPDRVCPAPQGFLPDLGSFMALIEACTGRRPEAICGKPNEQILIAAEHKTGIDRSGLLMVGDRLSTDIAIGQWGVRTALVLSGEATRGDVPSAPVQPTVIFEHIGALGDALAISAEG